MPDTNSPGVTKAELAAVKAAMPTPATSAPPSVADSSAKGTEDSSLIGLTILSLPASVGATIVHAVALEP